MTTLQLAIDRIDFARRYTLRLLDDTNAADWFRMPGEVTHIAWQAGHLAFAQYRLCLERLRGRQPGDERIISDDFLLQFGARSVPEPDPVKYPPPAEIRGVMDRVHQQVMAELPRHTEEELAEPPTRPHPLFDTKMGGLLWCSQHEMVHAGQIGLLRRLLGAKPQW
jgi:hypothetical protein